MHLMHAVRKLLLRQKWLKEIKDLIANNANCKTRYIAKCVGITVIAAGTIPRRDL
jgi:hypothetical protein